MDKQVLKLGARILENLPTMSADVVQGWIENPKALQDFLWGLVPQEKNSYLRHLLSFTLAPAKGSETIAEAKEVFTGYLDPDFQNWGTNQAGEDTKEIKVDVLEMSKDGTYQQLFGSLGRDPHSLCLSQGQIVKLCQSQREHLLQDGKGTFFLFEVHGVLFVSRIYVGGCQLRAGVSRFEGGYVWIADDRHRLMIKQQTV